MNRYIRLDEQNHVVSVRWGTEIVEGETLSESGNIGDRLLPDGTFQSPPVEPNESVSLEARVSELENALNFIIMGGI